MGEVVTRIPTIGFIVQCKNIEVSSWDLGWDRFVWQLYRHYFHDTQGLIFVIDSCDHDRMHEAAVVLKKLLSEELLRDAVLLVFANKHDLPNAMTPAEITQRLGLHELRDRVWWMLRCRTDKPSRVA
jgi:signal recognition particle receptor subunit beta